MQNLIDLTRGLIGDTDTVDRVFTDEQIETALNAHAEHVNYLPLVGAPVKIGGAWEQRVFHAPTGFWSNDAALFDTEYGSAVPVFSDLIAGKWTFSNHQAGIYLTGATCDVYAAAADLLTLWAGRSEYGKGQRGQALMDAAREMRKRMRPRVVASD